MMKPAIKTANDLLVRPKKLTAAQAKSLAKTVMRLYCLLDETRIHVDRCDWIGGKNPCSCSHCTLRAKLKKVGIE